MRRGEGRGNGEMEFAWIGLDCTKITAWRILDGVTYPGMYLIHLRCINRRA